MSRRTKTFIVLSALLVAAALFFVPGGRPPDRQPKLPWQATVNPYGQLEVFGLTLGSSTLVDARRLLEHDGKLNLFVSPAGDYAAEAFFEQVFLSGLKADFVLELDASRETLDAMFERGLRISQIASGAKRVELTAADAAVLAAMPVRSITYLPTADLDPELVERLFGTPERRIGEAAGIEHWLYPSRGIDVAMNSDGPEVIQYLNPGRFSELLVPLEALPTGQER